MFPVEIVGRRTVLREPTEQDAPALAALISHPEVARPGAPSGRNRLFDPSGPPGRRARHRRGEALLRLGFGLLGLHRIEATTLPDHAASGG